MVCSCLLWSLLCLFRSFLGSLLGLLGGLSGSVQVFKVSFVLSCLFRSLWSLWVSSGLLKSLLVSPGLFRSLLVSFGFSGSAQVS